MAYILYRKNGHHTIDHAVQQNVNIYHGHSWTIHYPPKKSTTYIFLRKLDPIQASLLGIQYYVDYNHIKMF